MRQPPLILWHLSSLICLPIVFGVLGDGMIQLAEYSLQKKHSMKVLDGAAKLKPRMQMIFNMSDANQDGMVSGDELKGAIMTADKEGNSELLSLLYFLIA